MRTDRGWKRFYATGWLVSVAITVHSWRQWKAYVSEVEDRAEETARRRAVEERLRIARELHDSLTHSISVIKVQAGVAIHLARKRGEEVSPALLAIQDASADAARELRSTLDVLRRDQVADSSGLDRLPALLERARRAGVPATLEVRGEPRSLPHEVDRTAYRIVQEALTNISRHAADASAAIRLSYGPGALTVQIDDDGRPLETRPVPGLGLIGMRERVTALGGRMRAEPRPAGGFSIRAELPMAAPS